MKRASGACASRASATMLPASKASVEKVSVQWSLTLGLMFPQRLLQIFMRSPSAASMELSRALGSFLR
jgi:hypothetical protein